MIPETDVNGGVHVMQGGKSNYLYYLTTPNLGGFNANNDDGNAAQVNFSITIQIEFDMFYMFVPYNSLKATRFVWVRLMATYPVFDKGLF